MILIHRKILFIHIPKTGGTTIGNILHPDSKPLRRDKWNKGKKYRDFLEGKEHFAEHLSYDDYKLYARGQMMSLEDFFVFTFVRNPYSRLYSGWKFVKKEIGKGNPLFLPKQQYINDYSFAEWVQMITNNEQFAQLLKPQFLYVKSHQCNFIGRYENFQEDLIKVCAKTNTELNQDIPWLNKTSTHNKEYLEHYDERTKDIVYDYYKEDFLQFQYEG